MWRVQCRLPSRVVEALQTGNAEGARGGLDAECNTAWITHRRKVHAWSLPTASNHSEAGAGSDVYAEYDIPPRVVGDQGAPVVHVASTDAGTTLWVVAGGVTSGVVSVARCDGAGAVEELGQVQLPAGEGASSPPSVTALLAVPSSRGGVLAVVGCDNGDMFLLEAAGQGKINVAAMDRGGPGGSGSPGARAGVSAQTPSKWGMAVSATKAALRFLREPLSGEASSVGAVKSLTWMPSPSRELRLLVLTATTMEEWEVDRSGGGSGMVLAHRALNPVKQALRSDGQVQLISAAAAPGEEGGSVVVLAAEGRRWSIHRAERRQGSVSLALTASAVPPAGAVPSSGVPGAAVYTGGVPAESALVVTAGGGAALFAGSALNEQLLLHDPAAGGGRVFASAAAPSTGGWLMLTELMGVVAYAPTPTASSSVAAPRGVASAPPTGVTAAATQISASATNVDPAMAEAAVRAEFAAYASGSGGAPAEAGFRLRAAGALSATLDTSSHDASSSTNAQPFASSSRAIVDALPKHWSGPDGPGPAVELHLDEKARRHDLFLQFLVKAAGVWNLLPAAEREVILEHGEMVAALLCVRSLHNEAAEMEEADVAMDEDVGSALALLRGAVGEAGTALQTDDAAVRGRPAAEVCYSRATSAASALLPALADSLERHAGRTGTHVSVHARAAALDTLSRALLGALNAAVDYRRHHAALYPPASSGATAPPPRWNAGDGARRALRVAAAAAALLRDEAARGGAPDMAMPLGAQLLALATPLLDACAANVNAAHPGSAARSDARKEYAAARSTVLPALMNAARAGGGSVRGPNAEFGMGAAGVTMDAVAAVAEAHFGYEQLAEVCEAAAGEAAASVGIQGVGAATMTAAAARLHHYMRTLRGAPADGEEAFSTFMFRRMMTHTGYSGGVGQRIAEMLQNTPDEFYDELSDSLRPHPPLLWLHQLRADDYAGAASTLHGLSSTGNGGSNGGPTAGATLSERRQYLSLAKLSLIAAGVPSNADQIISIDAALDLTSIQIGLAQRKMVMTGIPVDAAEAPLPPLRLVEACLERGDGQGDEDLLDAFAVFASSGGAFRRANKSLLEACWRKAASMSDWEVLGELRGVGSDAAYVRALGATVVARAARRCYDASFAVRLGPPFEEVLTPGRVLELLVEGLGCTDGEGDTDSSKLDPLREALGLFISIPAENDAE